MGNRANAAFLSYASAVPVIAYSHWGGEEWQQELLSLRFSDRVPADGYSPKGRLGDPSYYTRALLLLTANAVSGIDTQLGDNQFGRPCLVIDGVNGDAWFLDENVARALEGSSSLEWRSHRPDEYISGPPEASQAGAED